MAAVRRDITANPTDAQRFVEAVQGLKQTSANLSTADLGIASGAAGPQALSRWDVYAIWHFWSMQETFSNGRRNAAHSGPVFLPWHRWFLLVLEFDMRQVLGLGRDDFGLPYWNWAADGEQFTPTQQRTQPDVWSIIGGNGQTGVGDLIDDGPFSQLQGFQVRVIQNGFGNLGAVNRPLRRNFGNGGSRLPRQAELDRTLSQTVYDSSDWDQGSDPSLRNVLEGWQPRHPQSQMHNRVHVWVGGDMGPGTSPNDPVFFLNHCFVDKIWDDWQAANPGLGYLPGGASPQGDPLFRHRARDPLLSLLTRQQPSVQSMLDLSTFYTYE